MLHFVDVAGPDSLLVLLAVTPLELHVRRSATGLLLAWWAGQGGRVRVVVGRA